VWGGWGGGGGGGGGDFGTDAGNWTLELELRLEVVSLVCPLT